MARPRFVLLRRLGGVRRTLMPSRETSLLLLLGCSRLSYARWSRRGRERMRTHKSFRFCAFVSSGLLAPAHPCKRAGKYCHRLSNDKQPVYPALVHP